MINKPYSESCDQNRDPILTVIEPLLADCHNVLEIGSGTGQHAVYFAEKMPHLIWQTSDRPEYHAGILQWIYDSGLSNVQPPIQLDVRKDVWMKEQYDAVFLANTLHIMHDEDVEAFFANIASVMKADVPLMVYGPFNYDGQYTSESNARFDIWLKNQDPKSSIKHFEWLDKLAGEVGLEFAQDYKMPANNRILCWRKMR